MCGLFGFIGFEKQPIDFTTFLSLGIENDSRGGHGCGIFLDGEVEYGPSKDKYFTSFFTESELLKNHKTAQILVGHDRKASVGGVSDEKLQPVVIRNKRNQVDFVLMHNGTILNHDDLALKYLSMDKSESNKFTDSQIMARIVYQHGFNVFGEYEGAGVFVIIDYRNKKRIPNVFVFKGKSKMYSSSTDEEEERPLFYIREKNGLWFSSMMDYMTLKTFNTDQIIYTFPTNVVIRIGDKGQLTQIVEIDRSERHQKGISYSNNTSSPYTGGHTFRREDMYNDFYMDYNCDDGYCMLPSVQVNHKDTQIIENLVSGGNMVNEQFRYSNAEDHIPLTGVYYMNAYGKFTNNPAVGYDYRLYLFNGVPIYGADILDKILKFCSLDTTCESFDELVQYFPEVVYAFSSWPYYDYTKTKKYYVFGYNGQRELLSGKVVVPFGKLNDVEYEFKDGDMIGSHPVLKQTDDFYRKYNILCMKDYDKQFQILTV